MKWPFPEETPAEIIDRFEKQVFNPKFIKEWHDSKVEDASIEEQYPEGLSEKENEGTTMR